MLTAQTINTEFATRALGQTLPRGASDVQFLQAVFECAVNDTRMTQDLETILAGGSGGLTMRVARAVVRIPARVSIGSSGPGTHFTVRPMLFPRNRVEATAYALALLLDDDQPYRRDLRRCNLDTCRKFFLIDRSTGGRPRTDYCSPEHMAEFHRRTLVARVTKSRRKTAAARRHK